MLPVLEEQGLVLLYLKVILEHNVGGRLLLADVGVHGAVVVAGVLGAVDAAVLRLQFFEVRFDFLLSLQSLSFRVPFLLGERLPLLLFSFLFLLLLFLFRVRLLLLQLFLIDATSLHLLCLYLQLLRIDEGSEGLRVLIRLQHVQLVDSQIMQLRLSLVQIFFFL